jgi:hypothetical protein
MPVIITAKRPSVVLIDHSPGSSHRQRVSSRVGTGRALTPDSRLLTPAVTSTGWASIFEAANT